MLLPAALGACSSEPAFTPISTGSGMGGDAVGSTSTSTTSSGSPVCSDGETKACSVTLGQHAGILSCFHGTTTCKDGQWGECLNGTKMRQPAPGWNQPTEANQPNQANPGDLQAIDDDEEDDDDDLTVPLPQGNPMVDALSAPGPCTTNPCDPTCTTWTEMPPGGIHPPGMLTGVPSGNLGDLPPGLVNKGIIQPCQLGSQCQFDHFCSSPDFGTCSHDTCYTGGSLVNGCSACVSKVCAARPSCCASPPGAFGSCSHSPCITGGRLKGFCHPDVANFCFVYMGGAYFNCCKKGKQWDATCVAAYTALYPADCSPAGTWDATCVADVYSLCDDYCTAPTMEPHSLCQPGAPLDDALDTCVDQVCNGVPAVGFAGDPNCCTVGWNATCIAEATTYCDLVCGECVQWPHAGSDPNATGWDLTLGVACANSVPVCNRGNVTAPAGIPIKYYPGNSQTWPPTSCLPAGAAQGTCTTAAPIPPGQCISLACAFPAGQHEVMANPNNAVAGEDFCQNNWTLVDTSVSCNPAACSSTGSQASFKPVDMFITIDKSGSMNQPGRWAPAVSALTSFYNDPASAGLGVAQRFWPDNVPSLCDDPSCSQANCASPSSGWGNLPALAPTLITDLNAHSPGGGTPMYAALDGATAAAIAHQIANPTHKVVVVMITDGQPNGCNNSVNAIAGVAAAAFASPQKIQTYVIGIAGVSQSTIDQIATAGGGQSFFIASNTNTAAQLLSAMQAIRGNNTSCTFPLPNLGGFDPSKGSVKYSTMSMAPTTGTQVANAAACGAGFQWYYDNNANPTTITLCNPYCTGTIKADATAVVTVEIGCPTLYQPSVTKQMYQGVCPAGTTVQWGFLAYDTVTPSDSSAVFQGRFGNSAAAASAAAPVQLSNFMPAKNVSTANGDNLATLTPGHACTPEIGPPYICPVDIFTSAGLPNAQMSFLELEIDTIPSTDFLEEPLITSWGLTYSCPPSE